MAAALAGGMIKHGFDPKRLRAFDVSAAAAIEFERKTGLPAADGAAEEMLHDCATLVVAVKPQQIEAALAGKALQLREKLIISIAAGVKLKKLEQLTGSPRIVRVMPNTPALIGEGVSAYATTGAVTTQDIALTEKILAATGRFCRVREELMDAVTGVSGSGPAYVFEFIQALADGGVKAGLSAEAALEMATQTVIGAARLVIESGLSPDELRNQVASPGGTTIAALDVLKKRGFRDTVAAAVAAAAERSAELGNTSF